MLKQRHNQKWTCQNLKSIGKHWIIQNPSQWISYMVVILIFRYHFDTDTEYRTKWWISMTQLEIQEYA